MSSTASEIATENAEIAAEIATENVVEPGEEDESVADDASKDGDEDDEDEEEDVKNKKAKKVRDFTWPKPEDYPERANPKFKPTPFEDGVNITAALAAIRAKHAVAAADEAEALCRKHASSGQWPNGHLKVIYGVKFSLCEKAVKLSDDARDAAAKAAAAKEKRNEEKSKQLEHLKAALSVAFTDELMAEKNSDKDITDRIALGTKAAKIEFKVWAPKILSWSETAIEKACEIATAKGISEEAVSKILKNARLEDAKDSKEPTNKTGKRKAGSEASAPADTTPKKAKGGEEKKPPPQKEKYRIAKLGSRFAAAPAAPAEAATDLI